MIDNASVYRAMTAIQKASYGDIEPTFEEMKTALESAMKEESGIIYTTPKIKVTEPLKLCLDCKNYALKAADKTCSECLLSTSKAVNWSKK